MKAVAVLFMLLSTAMASRCIAAGSPLDELAKADVRNAERTGVKIGETVGAAVELFVPKARGKGAVLGGALVGYYTGKQIGEMAAARRKEYGSQAEFLDAEISTANKAVSSKEKGIADLRQRLANTKAEIASLAKRRRANEDVTSDARDKLEELDKQIASNNTLLAEYHDAAAYLDDVLNTPDPQGEKTGNLESKRDALQERKKELAAQFKQLHGLNSGFEEVRPRLLAMTNGAGTSTQSDDSSSGNKSPFNIPKPNDFIPKLPFGN